MVRDEARVVYEHYNCFNLFDPARAFPVKNWECNNKPLGGLWGSRVGATENWKKVMKKMDEHLIEMARREFEEGTYNPNSPEICDERDRMLFVLKDGANCFVTHSYADYLKLPKGHDENGKEYVDYIQCLADGIDAVELCSLGDEWDEYYDEDTVEQFDEIFCSHWSCDSIVVLNPDAYEVIQEAERQEPPAWRQAEADEMVSKTDETS